VTIRVPWICSTLAPCILSRVAGPTLLVEIFVTWAVTCAATGGAFLRRAPAVSLALFGSVLGAVGGFLVGNADGPAEAPAYTAVGASLGLFANGVLGVLATPGRPPSQLLRRAAWVTLLAGLILAGVLAIMLQVACPFYVSGRRTEFCNYQLVDQLGGWVSGVIVAFVVDAWFVAGLFAYAAWQARRSEDAMEPKWRRLARVDA
jgi:hypothetical protein